MKFVYSALIFCIVVFSFMQTGCRYDKQLLLPVAPCDTTSNIRYSIQVQPILVKNCLLSGCHGDQFPPKGVYLDTYPNVKAQLILVGNTPKLLGVIQRPTNFDPMPKGKDPLSNCDISTIEKWIINGAPQ